jgi:hypothetical protein
MSQENRDRAKNTSLSKFGVDNPAKSQIVKEKIRNTFLERYGVDNISKLLSTKNKIDETHFLRYGRRRASQAHISQDVIELKNNPELMRHWFNDLKMPVSEIADTLGVNHSQLCVHFKENLGIDITRHCVSTVERQVQEFLRGLDLGQIICNTRDIIAPKEIDIYIPERNLAFEINGLAWHCELRGKNKNYHLDKTQRCANRGIRLIHILDTEWMQRKDLVCSRITSILGMNTKIPARKCSVRALSSLETSQFLGANHIQGHCQSQIRLGLDYQGQLVAVMTFGRSRYNKNVSWELLRYCTNQKVNVVGGAGKLFKHFVMNHDPAQVISYCDLRWNTGGLYQKLGFEFSHDSGPNYWYTKSYRGLESRIKYQKHRLKNILENFDPNKTEWDNMVANGYDRFWDCGNGVWLWTSRDGVSGP